MKPRTHPTPAPPAQHFSPPPLTGLALHRADPVAGLVRVTGKGGRERIVPLGQEALAYLAQYLNDARPELLGDRVSEAVFVTRRGGPMSRQAFWQLI